MTNQATGRTTRHAYPVLMALMTTIVVGAFAVSASAQPRRSNAGITVFTNPNFSGESASFRDDMPDLRAYGLSDKISSLEISNGQSWEVCQDINFGNRCQVFSGSVSDLRNIGWNDRISSLRRVGSGFRGRAPGGVGSTNYSEGLVLYDRTNFRGNSMVVSNSANLGSGSGMGSARVRGGVWQLCDRSGRCVTVSQDVPDLSRLGLNGRITSARVINGDRNNNGWYDRSRRDDRWDRYDGR
jgi:hypothetical protein